MLPASDPSTDKIFISNVCIDIAVHFPDSLDSVKGALNINAYFKPSKKIKPGDNAANPTEDNSNPNVNDKDDRISR